MIVGIDMAGGPDRGNDYHLNPEIRLRFPGTSEWIVVRAHDALVDRRDQTIAVRECKGGGAALRQALISLDPAQVFHLKFTHLKERHLLQLLSAALHPDDEACGFHARMVRGPFDGPDIMSGE
jgi:hypothetical protein